MCPTPLLIVCNWLVRYCRGLRDQQGTDVITPEVLTAVYNQLKLVMKGLVSGEALQLSASQLHVHDKLQSNAIGCFH